MREYLCIAMLLVMILALLPGCGPSEADAAEAEVPRQLTFVIVNNSGGDINGIGISGANLPIGFSDLDSGERSSVKDKKLELPEKLTLHWGDERGNRKEGSVKVWGELGSTYTGPVTLTISRRGTVTLTGG